MSNPAPFVSVVIPVYNEEENVALLYEGLKRSLADRGFGWELIFVNDGSTDNSVKVLADLAHKDTSVKYMVLTRNFGQQAALTAGMDYARGNYIVTMDCDLQDPPEIVPAMIEKAKEGYEVVFARRAFRDESFFKRATASLYYKLLEKFSDTEVYGNIGDFRLITRKVLKQLKGMREKSRYLRGMVAWLGFRHAVLDYDRPKRIHGTTGFSLLKMVRLGMSGILNFSLLPIRFGLVIGLLSIFSGTAFLAYITYDTFINNEVYQLYKWLSVITFVFIGFMFILIWILAEYVGQIYNESKNRPIYVVEQEENFDHEPEITYSEG
ncbi:MAG TPA: glycosyltransferase [Flavobacteriales bacterium]|nr:glycosyltransferase [Flavobacteriales bacterium]